MRERLTLLHLCCSCRPFDRVVDFLGDRTLDGWPGSDKRFMALPEDDLQAEIEADAPHADADKQWSYLCQRCPEVRQLFKAP